MMNYERVLAAVLNYPWAILPQTLTAIAEVLARREAGVHFTEKEIAEVIGAKKLDRDPWLAEFSADKVWLAHRGDITAASGNGGSGGARKLIAVLPVYGIIGPKAAEFEDVSSGGGTGIDKLTAQFRAALSNPDVRSIVFDFDSPGGSVYGVDELASEIFNARDQKRIVAQIAPMCASAAYYLASACMEIACIPSGEVGSIGVFAAHRDISKAMEMHGIKTTLISAGKYKTEGNPYEPLDDDAREYMQGRVGEYYDMFIKAVARGREVKAGDVKNGFGQGRMVSASEAKKLGMIDRVATLEDTLARLGGDSAKILPIAASSTSQHPAAAQAAVEITAIAEPTKEDTMSTQAILPAASAEILQVRIEPMAEIARCNEIIAVAKLHGMTAKAEGWISTGKSIKDVQVEILGDLRAHARPLLAPGSETIDAGSFHDEADKTPGSIRIVRMARCLAFAKLQGAPGNRDVAREHALKMGDRVVASAFQMALPQVASTLAGGGALIPENFIPDLIEYLRPAAVFRSLGPSGYPLINGNLTLPKLSLGGSASYIGESTQPGVPASSAAFAQVKGSAKKLAALIPISNDLIRYAGLSIDAGLRDDMVRALAQSEDTAFIRGIGSQYSPKGLLYQALAANKMNSGITQATLASNAAAGQTGATATMYAILADVAKLELALTNANVRMIRPGILMSKRVENFLKFRAIDAMGNPFFQAEMARGTFCGYPYRATTVIPNNLSVVGSAIDSEIYLADFVDVVIADAPTISIEVSMEASWVDGGGVTHNAFQEDTTLVRFIEEHDLLVRHPESVAVLQGVEYGS